MITFRRMTRDEFTAWMTKARADYIADQIRVGN